MEENTSGLVEAHLPCDDCGSSDALALYEDGGTHCFSCNTTHKGGKKDTPQTHVKASKSSSKLLPIGKYKDLTKRQITAYTCRKWSYSVGKDYEGKPVQIATYLNDNLEPVAQKIRKPNKEFLILGEAKKMPMYGQWLWKAGGNRLIIVEGEIDALSVAEAYNNKFPVVSVPNGAAAAYRDIKKNFEWIDSFKEIVIGFDNDKVGKEAAQKVAQLFRAGKAKVCYWENAKDANEMLVRGDVSGILKSINEAKVYRPDELVNSKDIKLEELKKPVKKGLPYPYPKLQAMTYGVRGGELVIWTAGSGIGKSTLLRELAYEFVSKYAVRVGMIFLEEDVKKTAQSFIALDNNIPLSRLRFEPSILPDDKWEASYDKLFNSGMIEFYNHFGSMDIDVILQKIRYMIVGLGIDYIFLDHISIVVSGAEIDDERKAIDVLMTKLRSLVQETNAHISAIVHLKRKGGDKSFNEGGSVSLTDLRGSGGLEQLSDAVIALERNQQAEGDEDEEDSPADYSQIRILKNREVGNVGLADRLKYDKNTGRLISTEKPVKKPTRKSKKKKEVIVNDDF